MGAHNFSETVEAKTPLQGYKRLVSDAISDYGTGKYNGTISTCEMGSRMMQFKEYSEENFKEAKEFIEKADFGEKWVTHYVDVGKLPNGNHIFIFYGWAAT